MRSRGPTPYGLQTPDNRGPAVEHSDQGGGNEIQRRTLQ